MGGEGGQKVIPKPLADSFAVGQRQKMICTKHRRFIMELETSFSKFVDRVKN
jgi:hypothetical protein